MQKDQRPLPVLRHFSYSETVNQNTDIAGSTLNAFRPFINSVSAPTPPAHCSLANQNPNSLSREWHLSSYGLYFPAHPRHIHRLHMHFITRKLLTRLPLPFKFWSLRLRSCSA